jgi:hypothetical protein
VIGEVLFTVGGKSHLAFCLDAEGNLIRLAAEGNAHALIPYAVGVESLAIDLVHPKPWTISIAKVIERLQFLPSKLITGTEAETVLKTGGLPQVQYPYVPASEFADDDEQIEAAIQVWESLADEDETKTKIELAMIESGVHRIPRLASYVEALHIKTKPTDAFEVVSDGWMSYRKVHRKSVVRGG